VKMKEGPCSGSTYTANALVPLKSSFDTRGSEPLLSCKSWRDEAREVRGRGRRGYEGVSRANVPEHINNMAEALAASTSAHHAVQNEGRLTPPSSSRRKVRISAFLRLPAELRNQINGHRPRSRGIYWSGPGPNSLELLFVCRRIRQ
jgi:hypothetical protein